MSSQKKKIVLDENIVAENIREIIEKLSVSATIEVSREDNTFLVDIDSEDSALLIGKHGYNLESLQFILAVRIKMLTETDDFEIYVDINGWRKQKEERLTNMAMGIAQKVVASGQSESLFDLSASERRVVHTALGTHPQVETISEGEGQDRHIIIKPR